MFDDRLATEYLEQKPATSPDSERLQSALQNVSVPTPIVSFFSLRVLDGSKPSVDPCQLLDGLRITYVTRTLTRPTTGQQIMNTPSSLTPSIISSRIP